MIAFNRTQQKPIANKVAKTENVFQRMKGLLGRSSLDPDQGLWIQPCNSIHTLFMKFPIDVAFLSNEFRIIKLLPSLSPFRLSPIVWNAQSVLELSAGTLRRSGTTLGDYIEFRP